jgi:hypothetical protein
MAMLALLWLAGCATAPVPKSDLPAKAEPSAPAPSAPAPSAPAVEELATAAPIPEVPPIVPTELPESQHPLQAKMLSVDDFVDRNDENLLRVYSGMSRVAVERIMGHYRTDSWSNPYKRQQIAVRDGRVYEVLFYVTRKPRAGNQVNEGVMTPVIFEHERVTAIGRYPLKKLRRTACQARGEAACP